jgi:hypothetical protein
MLIELSGRIDENGQLVVELPPGLPPGEVRVTIEGIEDIDAIAKELDELYASPEAAEDEARWDALLSSPQSLAWLEKMREKIIEEDDEGFTEELDPDTL